LKLTVDSSEPLDEAMRVLGALYGVTLVVSKDEPDMRPPTKKTASRPAKGRRTVSGRQAAARATRSGASAVSADAVKPTKASASRSSGSPNNAEVRSWARQTGLTVSDRGRIPASVMTAYRDAQTG
jgi:Lsr2